MSDPNMDQAAVVRSEASEAEGGDDDLFEVGTPKQADTLGTAVTEDEKE